jgi:hypothetical protein
MKAGFDDEEVEEEGQGEGKGTAAVEEEDNNADPYSSFFYRELEHKALTEAGVTERELYTGNRTLGVLADFFYDSYTARNYERGLLLKGKQDFIGKTVCVSRNKINNLLTTNCQVSGLGVYRVTYCVSWTGRAEPDRINDLFKLRQEYLATFQLDTKLCRTLKSQPQWKYMIVDLEKTNNSNDILMG